MIQSSAVKLSDVQGSAVFNRHCFQRLCYMDEKKKSCPEHKGNVCVNHQLPQLLKKKKKILPAEGVWFPVQIKAATGAASVKFHQLSKSETSRSFSLQLHQ